MTIGRTLLLAVDGLDEQDLATLRREGALSGDLTALQIRAGGPSEPAPALASLVTGASVAHTGVATQVPFRPDLPDSRSTWYASSVTAPTLFEAARERGLTTAALHWPATAGAEIDLCLPLVEDLRRYRTRWDMAERTSSPRMVAEHLVPRREAGVQLSQVPSDDLVAEIAAEALIRGPVQLLAARLTGLGIVRRESGPGAAAERALLDTADALRQIQCAFAPDAEDRVLLVPGRRLVPAALLVHPNAALAAAGLLRTDGTRLDGFRALVWPDGPRGVLHVRREEGDALRTAALEALAEIAAHSRLQLRTVDDGVGATEATDVIAVLEGTPGTVVGLSPTHRPLVDGDDPYYAGPRAVSDPSAPAAALVRGPGLPSSPVEGSWADLGVTLAHALDLELSGATAQGMHRAAPLGRA
ncbi:alkaline phosphatase family protein [Brachybacterium sp. YJGR34]|uniref:alkaline phosphatase family protein n=1 Tax=Brachybacterium sp. YJGR34 TaxID=2059911 RepID=UPI000E0A1327|nr:alkaline phosphatase family protein [Brachybacterium sp. YJGR34]